MATKYCPICGVADFQSKFRGNYCIECFKINRNDELKNENLKKRVSSKRKNLLEETCGLANELGLTYAQYQIKETCNMIRDNKRFK